MPLHAALEAHLIATSAYRWLASLLIFLDVAHAGGEGTPAQVWIEIDHDVFVKLEIFSIYVL